MGRFAIAMTHHCGLSTVTVFLAEILEKPENTDPWLIVTDLNPQQAQVCWYGMRSGIECLFKDIKRGGFAWHHTKMDDPERAERLGERDRCCHFIFSQCWWTSRS
jgi:hypothetical protein